MRRALMATLAVLLILSMLVACSQTSTSTPPTSEPEQKTPVEETKAPETSDNNGQTGEEGKVWKIAVMPKLIGIPYFNASEVGALKAGEDLGVDVQYVGPTNADATEQVKMIEDLINQGIDALCVAPNDPAALSPVLQKAKDAGIVVLDWDTPANPDDVVYSINQVDQEEFARLYYDKAVEIAGKDDFKYAILTGGLNAANLNNWIDLGLKYAKEKYPKLELVTERIPTDESQQLAYQKTLELLSAYPDLEVILGYSTPTPLGAAMAVREKNLNDKVVVIGSSTPKDSVQYLEDGSLDAGLLWDPSQLGYLTVFAAKEVLEGRELKDGQEVPNVGKVTVNGKVVVMGPPSIWTVDNAKDYDF
ncbi:MAG: autoinducer 2 ABC transporter substrate-binding protein [Clostridiaceae bacterium]|nr:autoinducer 2 ABC transporter substrate-binding protein [Clostridiaceae bacterium]